MVRDNKFEIERMQALKLVRKFIDTPKGVKLIPQSIIYVLISIIEQMEDKLRPLCMETLNELGNIYIYSWMVIIADYWLLTWKYYFKISKAIRNVKLVASCGGIKIIFSAMTEGPMYLTEMNMLTVIYLLDTEKTRNYIKPEVDLEIIISAFSDSYSKTNYSEEQLKLSSKAILALFKSWTGILQCFIKLVINISISKFLYWFIHFMLYYMIGMTYLCFQDKRAINIIIETLRISKSDARVC